MQEIKLSPSPRQTRINYVNALINVIGYYTGIFFHGLGVSYILIDGKSIYFIDCKSHEKINLQHKTNGWKNFTGNENQKNLLKAFKRFIMNREPVSIEVLKRALDRNIDTKKLNQIIREGIEFNVLEGNHDHHKSH